MACYKIFSLLPHFSCAKVRFIAMGERFYGLARDFAYSFANVAKHFYSRKIRKKRISLGFTSISHLPDIPFFIMQTTMAPFYSRFDGQFSVRQNVFSSSLEF